MRHARQPVELDVVAAGCPGQPGECAAAQRPRLLELSFEAVHRVACRGEQRGHPLVAGIALFAWGTVELFIVDKTLRPRLVGGPIKLPFLPTFFGLIGGVKTMGFLGLFVGPVLMALMVAIWREWMREVNQEEEVPGADPAEAAPPVPEGMAAVPVARAARGRD